MLCQVARVCGTCGGLTMPHSQTHEPTKPTAMLPDSDGRRHSSYFLLVLLLALLATTFPSVAEPVQLPAPKHAEYRIAIHCALKVLQLWRNDQLVREYAIEIGKGGTGKRRNGDHRTPVGDYEVSWMASRDGTIGHKIIDYRSWCKDNCFSDACGRALVLKNCGQIHTVGMRPRSSASIIPT